MPSNTASAQSLTSDRVTPAKPIALYPPQAPAIGVIPSIACTEQKISSVIHYENDGTELLIGMAIELLPSRKWSASSIDRACVGKVFETEEEAVNWIERTYQRSIEFLNGLDAA